MRYRVADSHVMHGRIELSQIGDALGVSLGVEKRAAAHDFGQFFRSFGILVRRNSQPTVK